jgi:MoxR-like ATPase
VLTGLDDKRVQFTPDLMPADILGSEVLEEADGKRQFRFIEGPVFCQLLMADEINRASPRTQSALLQAMQEHHVTVAGERHDLPRPSMCWRPRTRSSRKAPIRCPKPSLTASCCRSTCPIRTLNRSARILLATTGSEDSVAEPVLNAQEILDLQQLVRAMPVGEAVLDAILALLEQARPDRSNDQEVRDGVSWGPGPRAGQALMLAVRARALLQGRLAPSTEDVLALAEPVLKHRMALSFAARAEGLQLDALINRLAKAAA